jgi:hypothetical protein
MDTEKFYRSPARAENGWISVKDRLPENDTWVLAYMADRQSVMVTYFVEDFALTRLSPPDGFSGHGVTHWIPLP